MTQNAADVEIANQGFAAFRQDLNDVLEDITTLHSGTAAPSTTYANQWWYETDTDKLYIRMKWSTLNVGEYLLVEAYSVVDPETYTDVYNDYFLKKYTTALLKMQWGMNLLKFEGMQMPGGVTFNGRQLFDDAREEITKLEEEVRLNWEQPVDFYTG